MSKIVTEVYVNGKWAREDSPLGSSSSPAVLSFEVGQIYHVRSICDHNCIWNYRVVSRTAKQITLCEIDSPSKQIKRGVYVYEGVEQCRPDGSYSMCPILSASKAGEKRPDYQ